jgi:hypothetical protein
MKKRERRFGFLFGYLKKTDFTPGIPKPRNVRFVMGFDLQECQDLCSKSRDSHR